MAFLLGFCGPPLHQGAFAKSRGSLPEDNRVFRMLKYLLEIIALFSAVD